MYATSYSIYYFSFYQLLCLVWWQNSICIAFVSPLTPRLRRRHGLSTRNAKMPPQSDLICESSTTTINIIAIRHGSSVSNEWMTGSNAWFSPTFCDDIEFVDSPLSEKGISQAQQELPKQLQCILDSTNLDDLVVLVSPLTRCLQTWYYGVQPLLPSVPTMIVPLLRERVYSASDTGKPWRVLQSQCRELFTEDVVADLDWSLLRDSYAADEAWWYTVPDGQTPPKEWRPCGEQQYYAVPGEPETVFRERLQVLEEWLRREFVGKTVVVVSHWGVLHHFSQNKVPNCCICQWSFDE
jgi:broad specificity phosphatase PhoE